MMEFWGVVQNTPIAMDFLAELLKLKFAETGEKWAKKLMMGDIKNQLLAQFTAIIKGALSNPAEIANLGPQEVANLQQLVQTSEQVLSAANNEQGTNNESANRSNGGGTATSSTGEGEPGSMATDAGNPNAVATT